MERTTSFALLLALAGLATAQTDIVRAPRIWDDKALEDWATPVAALGIRPGHSTAAKYGSGANSGEVRYRVRSAASVLSIGIRQRAPRSIVLTWLPWHRRACRS